MRKNGKKKRKERIERKKKKMENHDGNIAKALLHWYDKNKRILRWREEPKPYYIWISEIMLQQTRVEAVKSYFDRFVDTLPTISDLAFVEEEKLLKLWEGLGYYNRVKNLQKAAQIIVAEYGGELPPDYKSLLSLPGIGPYTAGAIASIAYQIKVPAVDGNVLRVMKRVEGSYDDITKASVKKQMELDLLPILPDRAGDFNQAIMDLGATICLPNGKPLCEECPLSRYCIAYEKNIMMELPVKPAKKERRKEEKTVLIFRKEGKYAIRKRKEESLLNNLWELPNVSLKMRKSQVKQLCEAIGYTPSSICKLPYAKHIFTHIEWHMTGYLIDIEEETRWLSKQDLDIPLPIAEFIWVDAKRIQEEFALPGAFQAYKHFLL